MICRRGSSFLRCGSSFLPVGAQSERKVEFVFYFLTSLSDSAGTLLLVLRFVRGENIIYIQRQWCGHGGDVLLQKRRHQLTAV